MKILLIFGIVLLPIFSYSQILKNFGKKIEDKVNRKIDEKANRNVDKVLNKADQKSDDAIENTVTSSTSKKNTGNNTNNSSTASNQSNTKNSKTATSAKDFVAGTKILAQENFTQDAIGDFPVNMLTTSGGEVVTFNNNGERWLALQPQGSFTIKNFNTTLPKNFTFEFDITTSDNFSYYSTAIYTAFVHMPNYKKDYVKWGYYKKDKEGVVVAVHPEDASGKKGLSRYKIVTDGEEFMKNEQSINGFTPSNNRARMQFWRQGERLRVYVDGSKIWDLPNAFVNDVYNGIIFYIGDYWQNKSTDKLYITNLVLAEAGADTRHKLIETGNFSTNAILFETNKATILPSSATVLNELGQALVQAADFNVLITGHTDSDGGDADNQKLSQKRAESVKQYLVTNFNIAASRISTAGKGESEPIADNSTADGKAKNRRVEFKKVP